VRDGADAVARSMTGRPAGRLRAQLDGIVLSPGDAQSPFGLKDPQFDCGEPICVRRT
jgi:hypothetical protein